MTHRFIVFLSILAISANSQANNSDPSDMLQSLQDDMQEYSSIATRTRQNVDYMPYIVSAWNSDELDLLGISTLREAMKLVPGVDLSIGTVGTATPIFRGSNPFAMGQSKLVIDGVVVNDKMTGSYSHFLDMPIAMIQRIEIVRGPGSLLSYVNGYAGSIHVITKANRDDGLSVDNEVFVELGSSEYQTGGFVASYNKDNFSFSSDFYYKNHDQTLPVTTDRYGTSGDSQQRLNNYSLGINSSYNNLSVLARLSDKESGASYGQSFSLSLDESDFVSIENNFAEVAYSFDLTDDVKGEFSFGYTELIRELQNKVIPDGAMALVNGQYFLVDIVEETLHQRLELQIDSIDSHQINLGLHAYQSKMAKKQAQTSIDSLASFNDTFDILIDTPRRMYSIFVDDLIDLTEQTSIQVGIKYDHYSDVDNQTSPRLAIVHRYNDNNIYKFMYSHSYREPAWREQYLARTAFFSSTLDIKPEIVDAYELGYIRKFDLHNYFKVNAYFLSNKDQIHAQNLARTFKNNGDNNLYGLEIEYKHILDSSDEFYLNYSVVNGENVDDKLTNNAQNIAKAYYTHNINSSLSASVISQYISEKERIASDTRNDVSCYALFDLSVNYHHHATDTDLNLSIKNLFDRKYYLPSPENTYPDDFEQQGRSILFSLKTRFK